MLRRDEYRGAQQTPVKRHWQSETAWHAHEEVWLDWSKWLDCPLHLGALALGPQSTHVDVQPLPTARNAQRLTAG